MRAPAIALLSAALLLPSASAWAQQADFVAIHQGRSVAGSLSRLDPARTAPKLWSRTGDWFPYAEVFRFPAEAGSRYTLVLEYPSDGAARRIMICGDDPYRSDKVRIPPGADLTFLTDLATHPGSGCRETRRINLAVDARGNTRGLFLIVMAHQAAAPISFRLDFPAVPDAEVKAASEMPGCSKLGKIHWGIVTVRPIAMLSEEGSKPPKPGQGGVLVVIKPYGDDLVPEGGKFTVPAGSSAVNFRANNQINVPERDWKIWRLTPPAGVVYEYGILFDQALGRDVTVDRPPLRTLKLPPGNYEVRISGKAFSQLALDYELVPPPPKRRP
jgi:hypothetical protein